MSLLEPPLQEREAELAAVPAAGKSALEHEFPAAEISRIAEGESWRKEVHRPATATHKWWAKRLGSVFRAILAAAVTESGQSALDGYSGAIDLDGLTVLDPFAGSGTTLVETAKLGGRAVAFDINPVATLVERQAVARWDAASLAQGFAQVEVASRDEIDRLHRTDAGEPALYYFWVAVADCPDCGEATRLFSSHVFAQHAYPRRHSAAHSVCPACLDVVPTRFDFQSAVCGNGHTFTRQGAVERGAMTCPNGHVNSIIEALGGRAPDHDLYAKLVLGADGRKRYAPIDDFDRELYLESAQLLSEREEQLLVPLGGLEPGENTKQALRWGYREWRQFFNARQLYSLGLIGAAIRDLECGEAEREALAALFSGTLEFNNLFCSFKGEGTGAVRHMFSHHVLKPERTPLEAHPWGTPASSGSFSTLFERRILRAHDHKVRPQDQVLASGKVTKVAGLSLPLERELANSWEELSSSSGAAYIRTMDASETDLPDGSIDLIVTDPPYMDNVHYSELADFFHAWLRGLSPYDSYPSDAPSTRMSGEVQSPTPEGFGEAIGAVWAECYRVLKDGGLLAFTFHQARIGGWQALVSALADAGFQITAIQPVKGEMSTSSTKHGREPSNLDSIVVCRKTQEVPESRMPAAEAAAEAERKLSALREAGVEVGAGDVRSVVRGHVLATYTAAPATTNLARLAVEADNLAAVAVTAEADRSAEVAAAWSAG
ncbi:MAG: SAM-dependent methyltransferase [Solirubrobacterales bacterium]